MKTFKYEVVIYFIGPKALWSRQLSDVDVLVRHSTNWLWLAIFWARTVCKPFDPDKLGIAVLQSHTVVFKQIPQEVEVS